MKRYTHRHRPFATRVAATLAALLAPFLARAQTALDEAPRAAAASTGAQRGDGVTATDGTGPTRPRTATLRIGVNQGFHIGTADERVSLTIRAFVQPRLTVDFPAPRPMAPPDSVVPAVPSFTVRRVRLILQGALLGPRLNYQVHLGFAPQDLGNQSPLFDAFLTWAPSPSFQLRLGQFFVPFNRNRWISIMRQMFIERPLSTNEFNLDRDLGVMAFSNDLFSSGGRLGYALGIFGGGGRNRPDADYGFLYVARFHVNPLGRFDDSDSEWDLARSGPRLAIGVAGAFNHRYQPVEMGAIGAPRVDRLSAVADVLFKWKGLTLQLEALARWHPTGFESNVLAARSALGYFAQIGFVTPVHLALGARISQTTPIVDEMGGRAFAPTREISAIVAYLALDGALNVSLDYTNTQRQPMDLSTTPHSVRLQTMLIF